MPKKTNKHPVFSLERPWTGNDNKVWLASTISLYRNVEKFLFPQKLDGERRKQIISLVGNELTSSKLLSHPQLMQADELTPTEKEYLVEHFLTSESFHHAHSGEAFVLDDTGEFLTSLNINNHIQFEYIDTQGELENSWNHLVKIETALGKKINYAFSQKFGFLTADPAHCGSGFILKVFLQPSALIHTGKIDDILERLLTHETAVTGLQGDPESIIGDVYVIYNRQTLGVTEENIISAMRIFATKLLVEENSARSQLKKEDNPEIKDRVSRAYAVLMHSYQIETLEALDAISLLKLGLDLNLIKGIKVAELNELFFSCRRGHLLSHSDKDIIPEEIPHKRAEMIHKALKGVKLTFE